MGRPPGQALRTLRTKDRQRAVRPARQRRHDRRAVRGGAARVWVVDNGPSHRGRPSIERLEGTYRNLRLVHLPIHASWLNQVEIYFGILERKVLTPPDAASLDELAARILAFQARYQDLAAPFEWKFTRVDLDRLLQRLALKADDQLSIAA